MQGDMELSDVAYLTETGAVEKVYGGVRSVHRQEVPLFTQRTQLRTEEKRRHKPMITRGKRIVNYFVKIGKFAKNKKGIY